MRIQSLLIVLALASACSGGARSGADASKDTGARALDEPTSDSLARASDASPAAGAPSEAKRPRVLILGTSLTAGLGVDPGQAYPAVLQQMADSAGYKVEIVNGGLSGETSAGALRRIDWLLNDPVAAVVIETGANDGLRGLDPDSTAANIRAIIRKIHDRYGSAPVVLVQMEAPPNFGDRYTKQFHGLYSRVAKESGAQLMPFLLDSVAGVGRLNQADGIHPTAEGARIVARNAWRTLGPVLARLDPSRKSG